MRPAQVCGPVVRRVRDVLRTGVLVGVLLVAAGSQGLQAQAGARSGRVIGQVVAAQGGEPLAGLTVAIGARQIETDDVGMFQFADVHGHRTGRVAMMALLGNAAGAAVGYAAARSCIRLREPSRDALQSECSLGLNLGAGFAAVALPAIGSGAGAHWAGQTRMSRGMLTRPWSVRRCSSCRATP